MENIKDFIEFINEDTSAVGGPSVGCGDGGGGGEAYGNAATLGMGPVVNAQPSAFAGTTTGSDWTRGGGTIGSGDINVPYTVSGGKGIYMKQKAKLHNDKLKTKNHGSTRGKKMRPVGFDVKQLAPKKAGKVLNFDDFQKKNTETITKVKDF